MHKSQRTTRSYETSPQPAQNHPTKYITYRVNPSAARSYELPLSDRRSHRPATRFGRRGTGWA
ncbi:hypothetical protein BP00DRAFT_422721 [Aspergillus indologenus CBS 114.80]|uniref:Uncharacterized protein n=1 Tax=Aspergillus indologenus CBS 114.80 TaxID=1450541 RepID=A0A2V5JFA2_9EURO|nr:hypothetical protein BP00DRAFT_422721 [Aspergillus indologenus CBS 114.80]